MPWASSTIVSVDSLLIVLEFFFFTDLGTLAAIRIPDEDEFICDCH